MENPNSRTVVEKGMVLLTYELIHAGGTYNGAGFTRKQMEILGVGRDPRKGWLQRLIGTKISEQRYAAFIAARNTKPSLSLQGESDPKPKSLHEERQRIANIADDQIKELVELGAVDELRILQSYIAEVLEQIS